MRRATAGGITTDCWGQERKIGFRFGGYTTLDCARAAGSTEQAMTARFLRAAARRLEPLLRAALQLASCFGNSAIGFVLAILLAIRKIDLYLYLCVRPMTLLAEQSSD